MIPPPSLAAPVKRGEDRVSLEARQRSVSPMRWVAGAAVLATYLLIVAGGVVRTTGSGLGCPDWPLCQGRLLPPAAPASIIEYSHRLLASIVGILVVATVVLWNRSAPPGGNRLPASVAILALLGVQVGLGAVTVALELPPMIVLAHLGLAMLVLGALVMIWAGEIFPPPQLSPARREGAIRRLALAGVVAVYLLVISGAFMRASGASWACAGFPTCNGALLPFGSGRLIDLHLLHRLLAMLVAAHLVVTVVRCWRTPALRSARPVAVLLVAALAAQVAIGATMVSAGPGALIQALHLAGAAALWGSVVALWTAVGRVRASALAAG